eukprot:Sspe_Gene.40417::Locus_19517_Transcript_1_1_Confidence_1.000_Length_697::g.40417::m.40417
MGGCCSTEKGAPQPTGPTPSPKNPPKGAQRQQGQPSSAHPKALAVAQPKQSQPATAPSTKKDGKDAEEIHIEGDRNTEESKRDKAKQDALVLLRKPWVANKAGNAWRAGVETVLQITRKLVESNDPKFRSVSSTSERILNVLSLEEGAKILEAARWTLREGRYHNVERDLSTLLGLTDALERVLYNLPDE